MYRYKRVFLGILAVLVIIFVAITSVISYKKDQIVEDLVQKLEQMHQEQVRHIQSAQVLSVFEGLRNSRFHLLDLPVS